MAITIGLLSEVITHGRIFSDMLLGGNDAQTIEKFKNVCKDPVLLHKMIRSLHHLDQAVRAISASECVAGTPVAGSS